MLELTRLSKSFPEPNGAVRRLFVDLDFSVGSGDGMVAVAGRSGSGKTTLLRIMAGLDRDHGGELAFRGRPLGNNYATLARFRRDHIGFVTQRFDLLRDRDVVRNVALGDPVRRGSIERARNALARVGLDGFEHQRVGRLSGGECQRVALARALVKEPTILLADEPTGALDEATEDLVLDILAGLRRSGTAIVIATHSARVMARCDRTLELRDLRLCAV